MIGAPVEGVRYVMGQQGRYHLRKKRGRLGWYGEIRRESLSEAASPAYFSYWPRTEAGVRAWGDRKLDRIERRANEWKPDAR